MFRFRFCLLNEGDVDLEASIAPSSLRCTPATKSLLTLYGYGMSPTQPCSTYRDVRQDAQGDPFLRFSMRRTLERLINPLPWPVTLRVTLARRALLTASSSSANQ